MKEILEPRGRNDNAWIPPEVWKPVPWWGLDWCWPSRHSLSPLPQRFWYWRAKRKHRFGHLLNSQGFCCVCGKRQPLAVRYYYWLE